MTDSRHIRQASPADIHGLKALLAPEILAGTVMPRGQIDTTTFLVATDGAGLLVGCVALDYVTAHVAELGALVAAVRGLGLGRALVEAAMDLAARRGFSSVLALTAAPGFFERCGFAASPARPWLRARRARGLPSAVPLPTAAAIDEASVARSVACERCPRLAGCRQAMLIRRTAWSEARRA